MNITETRLIPGRAGLILLCIFGFSFAPFSRVSAQLEEEFFQVEEWVETAAKRVQPVEESPAAVSVINEEDIRHSGATNLGDLLRMVPGLEVMSFSPSDFAIGARGQCRPFERGVLVLVNGRSVYEDYFGIVFWNKKDFSLEEIKKIEVVRGPGSVLYGANAFHAVVNIITKAPVEAAGGHLFLTAGPDAQIGTVMEAGKTGTTAHVVSAGWTQFGSYADRGDPVLRYPRGRFSLGYDLGSTGTLQVEGGVEGGDHEIFSDFLGMMKISSLSSNLMIEYAIPDFYARAFWNMLNADRVNSPRLVFNELNYQGILPVRVEDGFEFETELLNHVFDLEAQKILDLPAGNLITAGADFRYDTVDSTVTADYRTLRLFGAYLQHEFFLGFWLHTYLGIRYDRHELTGNNFSPRASVLLVPRPGHTFRFSYGRSFRNPSILESYLDLAVPLSIAGTQSARIDYRGNPGLSPEKLDSFEFGYLTGLFRNRLRFNLSAFYNRVSDLIIAHFTVPPIDEILAGTAGVEGKMTNILDKDIFGTEAEVRAYPLPNLSVFANYTFTRVEDQDEKETDRRTPAHRANGGAALDLANGFSASLWLSYTGEAYWPHAIRLGEDESDWYLPVGTIDPYTLVNLRLAYRFLKKRAEAAVSFYNLWHLYTPWNISSEHREFPLTDEIGPRVTGRIQLDF